MRYLIHRNPERDPDCAAAYRVRDILAGCGNDAVISAVGEPQRDTEFDMVICLGGDGTILDAAATFAPLDVPILGINLGNVGFMTAFDTPDGLLDIINGDYLIDERSMLEVCHNGMSHLALNDAVLTTEAGRTVRVTVSVDGAEAYTLRGDGIIAATPTGSTAYSMSAGGPVTHPQTNCVLLTPVCSHTAYARPFVLPDCCEVSVICDRNVLLCIDGRPSGHVSAGDSVVIHSSEKKCRLIRLKNYSFYDMIKQKLWTL